MKGGAVGIGAVLAVVFLGGMLTLLSMLHVTLAIDHLRYGYPLGYVYRDASAAASPPWRESLDFLPQVFAFDYVFFLVLLMCAACYWLKRSSLGWRCGSVATFCLVALAVKECPLPMNLISKDVVWTGFPIGFWDTAFTEEFSLNALRIRWLGVIANWLLYCATYWVTERLVKLGHQGSWSRNSSGS